MKTFEQHVLGSNLQGVPGIAYKPEVKQADIIGDVHGCYDELIDLLKQINVVDKQGIVNPGYNRQLVFVGDLVDRGPKSWEVLRLVKKLQKQGALIIMGNHDNKLMRAMKGNPVKIGPDLKGTLDQLAPHIAESQKEKFIVWLNNFYKMVVLDNTKLLISHAGIPKRFLTSDFSSNKKRRKLKNLMYGDKDGDDPKTGLPIRSTTWTDE